jgi:hypothetical protein
MTTGAVQERCEKKKMGEKIKKQRRAVLERKNLPFSPFLFSTNDNNIDDEACCK